jgi:hypothetical protein
MKTLVIEQSAKGIVVAKNQIEKNHWLLLIRENFIQLVITFYRKLLEQHRHEIMCSD